MYSGKLLFLHYYLQLSFVCKTISQLSFKLFYSGDNEIRKWGCFQEHNQPFPKYLSLKLKFQKTETHFCRWKSTGNNDINIFLSLENPCTFFLAKEKTWKYVFNTNCELSQNYTQKQIMPFKTTVNWPFRNICYLVIGCFYWKMGVFQKTVVRGLFYP